MKKTTAYRCRRGAVISMLSLSLMLTGAAGVYASDGTETESNSIVLGQGKPEGIKKNTSGTESDTQSISSSASEDTEASGSDILDTSDMFSERDLEQEADLTEAVTYTVSDGEDIQITEEGVYVLTGTASDVTVYVDAEDTDKVQLVLDGLNVTNADAPVIYGRTADKIFVTIASDSSLTVTGYVEDTENADAAIFSKTDLVLNGTAALTIDSADTGIESKDDLKITGGTYDITADAKAIDANDSIRISGGTFTLTAGTDGIHAENTDDGTKGYVYISGGSFTITAADDGIHGTGALQIDGGTFVIDAAEGIEATYIQINGGEFDITASDDGINASRKSNAYNVTIEITGGDITISMGAGDTDAIDANGDLIIIGGNIDITANSAFDYDGIGTLTGGTVTVNGEEVTELTQMMMGGRGMGGMRGGMGRGGMGGRDSGNMGNGGEMPDMPTDGNMTFPGGNGEMPGADANG